MDRMTEPEIKQKLREMAGRIKELREIEGLSTAEMAAKAGVAESEYEDCEAGSVDLNFAFIYRCATVLGVDVTDIIEGASPKLSSYTLTRKGEGQRIDKARGLEYFNMAPLFKNRAAEPLCVTAKFMPEQQNRDIELTTHEGQEFDLVIKGRLKVQVGDHTETLNEGDTIYYDSATPHGMIAVGGEDCIFYAIVLNPAGAGLREEPAVEAPLEQKTRKSSEEPGYSPVYENFIITEEDKNGALKSISFKDEDKFNFAFDVVDAIARRKPNKLAMLHVDGRKTERYFSFGDMSRYSSRAANYYKSLGIKRGDRVLLILKRHYQFWFSMLGLHKIGAVAIPAPVQLTAGDLEYRFNAGGISAVLCTSDGTTADEVDAAAKTSPTLQTKIIVGGARENWHDFDEEFRLFGDEFVRASGGMDPCGDDLMLMFFTSGTTGHPKMAAHSFKYPLGHFITAKYWHCVNPDGLHFTISDTGWAKAMWGKLYGQWLCEAAVFTYDFDRFDANDIMPMFAKYKITTFCAPPTMYRFFIKQDLSKFDLSAIEHASTAGEALNPEVFHQFKKAAGLSVTEGFGQSESTVIIGNLVGTKPRIGSMGKPTPLYDVDLTDSDGKSVNVGEVGEIVIKIDKGLPCGLAYRYYMDDEKTGETWSDGLYHTGDTAWRDEDGYFWYVGRVDDLIKSSGYRIGPFEIESVIMELPYVLECGVSAVPDDTRGQIVKASVVLTDGTQGTEELKKEIQEYVKKKTAPYKYPRIVVFREELPKTISGKIQRNLL